MLLDKISAIDISIRLIVSPPRVPVPLGGLEPRLNALYPPGVDSYSAIQAPNGPAPPVLPLGKTGAGARSVQTGVVADPYASAADTAVVFRSHGSCAGADVTMDCNAPGTVLHNLVVASLLVSASALFCISPGSLTVPTPPSLSLIMLPTNFNSAAVDAIPNSPPAFTVNAPAEARPIVALYKVIPVLALAVNELLCICKLPSALIFTLAP